MSHFSSNGYRCYIRHSRKDFPTFNCTALMTSSLPGIGVSTTPSFHLPLFRSSPLIRTTSPALTLIDLVLCLRLCRSLSAFTYSRVHLDHKTSLHLSRYLARFLRSASSIRSGSISGRRFGWPNNNVLGVSMGNCTSSST